MKATVLESKFGSHMNCRIVINHLLFEETCDILIADQCKNHLATQVLNHFGMCDLLYFSDFDVSNFLCGCSFNSLLAKLIPKDYFYDVELAPAYEGQDAYKVSLYVQRTKVEPDQLIPDLSEKNLHVAKEVLAKLHFNQYQNQYITQMHRGKIEPYQIIDLAVNLFGEAAAVHQIKENSKSGFTAAYKKALKKQKKLGNGEVDLNALQNKELGDLALMEQTPLPGQHMVSADEINTFKIDNMAGNYQHTAEDVAITKEYLPAKLDEWDDSINEFTKESFQELYGGDEINLPISQLHNYAGQMGFKVEFETSEVEAFKGDLRLIWSSL